MPIETTSDRSFGCFNCADGQSKNANDLCPKCGSRLDFGPQIEGRNISNYVVKKYVSRGHYGAMFKAVNSIGVQFALKIIPKARYDARGKPFSDEVTKHATIASHPNVAQLFDAGQTSLEINSASVQCYFLVMEWIEGIPLSDFITQQEINIAIVYEAIYDIASALTRFETAGLLHNDLNAQNILVTRVDTANFASERRESPYRFVVVDIGSSVFRAQAPPRVLSDLGFFGQHIDRLRQAAITSAISLEEQYFLDRLAPIIARLADESQERRYQHAAEAFEAAQTAYRSMHTLWPEETAALTDPFSYLNANDFPNSTYISRLISTRFPWVQDIIGPAVQSMLVTGPRGSGKTMILRSMRLKTRLASSDIISLESDPYLAFYVSARLEIGNHSLFTKIPKWMQDDRCVVAHFHLLYACEVMQTLLYGIAKDRISIDRVSQRAFCEFFSDMFSDDFPSLDAVYVSIRRYQQAILDMRPIKIPVGLLSASFLGQLAQQIQLLCPAFHSKNIVYLLDDFSAPKVPGTVQKLLLPVIWNSGAGYTFRVSAHSESIDHFDARGVRYERNREYTEVNLGESYIRHAEAAAQPDLLASAIDEVFNKRFTLSGHSTGWGIKAALGVSKFEDIAEEISARMDNKNLHALKYSGWNTVLSLCSGDISYLIELLRSMYRGVGNDYMKPISVDAQHNAIRQYAGQELLRLKECPDDICNLYQVAHAFGKLSKAKLRSRVKEGRGTRPGEYLKIEVELTDDEQEFQRLLAGLLQNGIFVDGGVGSSSRKIPTRRLIYRKMLTPFFPTTYRSRDSFSWGARRFKDFVRSPQAFAAEAGHSIDDDTDLFGSTDQ